MKGAPVAPVLRQAWWAPIAALLLCAQLVMAVSLAAGVGDESDVPVWIAVALVGAVALAVGLWKRPSARGLGNALILIGAAFAAAFFWTLVMPIGAIVVVAGVVTSEVRSSAGAPQAS